MDEALAVFKDRDALEGVDDDALRIDQHQVGVFAHQLRIERAHVQIAQLIARFHIDAQHAVKSDLFDPADESAVQLLAQQHDEVARRLHRRIRSLRQVQAVIGAVKRSEQAPVSLRRAQRPQQFHIGYILDLADLARQVFLQFAADLMQQQSVQSHFDHTPL